MQSFNAVFGMADADVALVAQDAADASCVMAMVHMTLAACPKFTLTARTSVLL